MNKFAGVILIIFIAYSNQINLSELEKEKLKNEKNATQLVESCPDYNPINKALFDNSECDLVTNGPICLYNGDRVLLPLGSPYGMLGYWNFDEIKPLDSSGNRNHGIGNLKPGPGIGGIGSSVQLTNGEYIEIPYNKDFNTNNFSITFWIFLIQDFFSSGKGIRFCPLVQRGKGENSDNKNQKVTTLYLDIKENNLQINITTTEEESLTSNSKLSFQRWTHISIINQNKKLKLYVNGILDSEINLKDNPTQVESALYIGNLPWLKDQCDYPFLLDEYRYYNIAIDEYKIQSEASPALGGIEPNFIKLGCFDCTIEKASKVCPENYRICTSIELHVGGYQIARSLGLLSWNTHLWTHNALKTPTEFEKLKGLALCCSELN